MTAKTEFCPCHPSSTPNVSSPLFSTLWNELMLDSKIVAGKTKNIFVDTTATDKTKL